MISPYNHSKTYTSIAYDSSYQAMASISTRVDTVSQFAILKQYVFERFELIDLIFDIAIN